MLIRMLIYGWISRLSDFCDEIPSASVTWKVKLLMPAAVGVPVIFPVAEAMVKPAGKVPTASDQVWGFLPNRPARSLEYFRPTRPLGSLFVAIASAR